jgi:hypothetical protein
MGSSFKDLETMTSKLKTVIKIFILKIWIQKERKKTGSPTLSCLSFSLIPSSPITGENRTPFMVGFINGGGYERCYLVGGVDL